MLTQKAALLGAVAFIGMSGAAVAQNTAFDTQNRAADAVNDTQDAVFDDFSRETTRFGNSGRPLGWTGSIAARLAATTGNTDTSDIGIGARFGYFDGTHGHTISVSYDYGEDNSVTTSDSLLLGYDYTRELNNNLYAYGQLQLAYDNFSSYETDAFIGAGLGYRVFNDATTQWSIQAGPGYRYLEDQNGVDTEEFAISVGSAFSHRISDTATFTWDTDVLWSELDTLVTNELGLTVSMTDNLALRTSILTEYNSDPLPGFDDTDNTFAASIVYNFN